MFNVLMCLRVSAVALVLLSRIYLRVHHFSHLIAESLFVVGGNWSKPTGTCLLNFLNRPAELEEIPLIDSWS